jgi:small subunit ribosomal protein S16
MYRIVVMEARSSRQGTVVDTIGTYNPALKKDAVVVDKQKYEDWVKKGAQATDAVLRFVMTKAEKEKRWPKIVAKKEAAEAKAEKKSEEVASEAPTVAEETPATETESAPVQEAAPESETSPEMAEATPTKE